MTDSDCPYGATSCPKVNDLEAKLTDVKKDLADMRDTQREMYKILYIIVGIVTVSLGVNLGGVL